MADPTRHTAHDGGEQPDIAALLARAAEGDARCWERLLDLYARRVFALAKSRCRNVDEAEEITQSVFVTVATKLGSGQYLEQGRFEAWLFRIAMNRVRDEMRRRKRQAEPTDPGAMPDRTDTPPEDTHPADRDFQALRRALATLSDRDREVIELRHHASMSFKQMADLLDEPIGTLLARHHRALAKVRKLLEDLSAAPESTSTNPATSPDHTR